jgi:hypothetical protein
VRQIQRDNVAALIKTSGDLGSVTTDHTLITGWRTDIEVETQDSIGVNQVLQRQISHPRFGKIKGPDELAGRWLSHFHFELQLLLTGGEEALPIARQVRRRRGLGAAWLWGDMDRDAHNARQEEAIDDVHESPKIATIELTKLAAKGPARLIRLRESKGLGYCGT